MRVIVTGGTGFLGRVLVNQLATRGDDVLVLTRGTSQESSCRGVEFATWEPERAGPWMRQFDGADAVVHLAGASVMEARWTPARKRVLRDSRTVSTDLCARAIAEARRPPRVFVSSSAVGYYGADAGDRVIDEVAPAGTDFLAELCRDWEAAAAPARAAGVRVCHPRIGVVLGVRGGALASMLPAFRAFLGGPLGSGDQYLPWIHLRDAIHALEYALEAEALDGPFNVTAPEPVTMTDFAKTLARVLGRPSAVRVPSALVKVLLGESSLAVLGGQRAVPKRLMSEGFAFVFPDLQSALDDLLGRG